MPKRMWTNVLNPKSFRYLIRCRSGPKCEKNMLYENNNNTICFACFAVFETSESSNRPKCDKAVLSHVGDNTYVICV